MPDRQLSPKACITLHQVGVLGRSLFADNVIGLKDEAEFHGGYYEFPPVYCYPKPAEPSHLGRHPKPVLKAPGQSGSLPGIINPARVGPVRSNGPQVQKVLHLPSSNLEVVLEEDHARSDY